MQEMTFIEERGAASEGRQQGIEADLSLLRKQIHVKRLDKQNQDHLQTRIFFKYSAIRY